MNGILQVIFTKIAEIVFDRACGARGEVPNISWSGKRQKACICEPARLAQSYFGACTRAVTFEIDVFMNAEHMQRIFVHKYQMCCEQTKNSLIAMFANVK